MYKVGVISTEEADRRDKEYAAKVPEVFLVQFCTLQGQWKTHSLVCWY